MTALDNILGLLDGVQPAGVGSWKAMCPAHPDQQPSLVVTAGDGKVLLRCCAGCDTGNVIAALGLKWPDLFDASVSSSGRASRQRAVELVEVEADFRHAAYSNLLRLLQLSVADWANLVGRGLSTDAIVGAGYRSLDTRSGARAARLMQETWKDTLFLVPGFYSKGGKPRLSAATGLLIPVRDWKGRIVGCQVRTGEVGSKYKWLSSISAASGSPGHCPVRALTACNEANAVEVLRLTEGPLKADVATHLDPAVPCVAVAGVAAWRSALSLLEHLRPKVVRLAFDADWQTKEQVAAAVRNCGDALQELGHEVLCEVWDLSRGKGIDDLLLAGGYPEVVSAADVEASVPQL